MDTFTVSVIRHGDQTDTINHRVEAGNARDALRQVAAFYPVSGVLSRDARAAAHATDQT